MKFDWKSFGNWIKKVSVGEMLRNHQTARQIEVACQKVFHQVETDRRKYKEAVLRFPYLSNCIIRWMNIYLQSHDGQFKYFYSL